ncbi:TadE/TadG family type IV pilus assembly protein [Cellulomonas sp. McL0617]|uniref:TadE/TadG family type IV pilus assembly protein n=1 Tax=Cellulomonas sp. McL0617 TaxID=3415675 RepID=UPI003CEE7C32
MHWGSDNGSAIVDFTLVGALVTVLFVGILQLTLVLHVRNTLIDSASEGARYGAQVGHVPDDGAARTRVLIGQSLAGSYAQDVTATTTRVDGLDEVEVDVVAPLPVLGLLGPARTLTIRGHALAETP